MPIEIGIISVSALAGALLIVLLQVLFDHWLARTRDRESRQRAIWNSDCLRFREAFDSILADLSNIEEPYSVAKSMRLTFPSQQPAYAVFRQRLAGSAKAALDKAWSEYEKYHQENEELTLRLFGIDVPEADQKRIVIGHVTKLLSFAKET